MKVMDRTMNWGDVNENKLVELVRPHQILWDKSHIHYYRQDMTEKIWDEIGKELGCSGSAASHQFHLILRRIKRYLLKKKDNNGTSRDRPRLFYDKLDFLKKVVRPRMRNKKETIIIANRSPIDDNISNSTGNALISSTSKSQHQTIFLRPRNMSPFQEKDTVYSMVNWSSQSPVPDDFSSCNTTENSYDRIEIPTTNYNCSQSTSLSSAPLSFSSIEGGKSSPQLSETNLAEVKYTCECIRAAAKELANCAQKIAERGNSSETSEMDFVRASMNAIEKGTRLLDKKRQDEYIERAFKLLFEITNREKN